MAQFGHRREFKRLACFSSFRSEGFDAADGEVWLKSTFVAVVAKMFYFPGDLLLKFSQWLQIALDSDPNDAGLFRVRETAGAFEGEVKWSGMSAGAAQRRGQVVHTTNSHVAEKLKGEVEVFRVDPTHHAAGRTQALLDFPDFSRQARFQ